MGGSGCPRGFIRCPHVFGDALCFAEEEAKTSKDQGGKCGLKKPWKQQVGNEIERRFFLHNPKLCIRKCRWSGRISDLNQIYSRALTKSDGLGGLPFFSKISRSLQKSAVSVSRHWSESDQATMRLPYRNCSKLLSEKLQRHKYRLVVGWKPSQKNFKFPRIRKVFEYRVIVAKGILFTWWCFDVFGTLSALHMMKTLDQIAMYELALLYAQLGRHEAKMLWFQWPRFVGRWSIVTCAYFSNGARGKNTNYIVK